MQIDVAGAPTKKEHRRGPSKPCHGPSLPSRCHARENDRRFSRLADARGRRAVMSLELVNTLATCGTFVVIAATAIAAIVQLRHLRASNQIAAFNELRQAYEHPNLSAAHKYVDTQLAHDLEDPAFRYAIGHRFARTDEAHGAVKHLLNFGHFFESAGISVKTGLVQKEIVLETWSDIIVAGWTQFEPVTAIFRRTQDPLAYEAFEYLTVLARQWQKTHPNGSYPKNLPRIKIDDTYAEADRRFAESLRSEGERPAAHS